MTIGVGLRLQFSLFKKKFNGTLQMSPVAYTMRYVERKRLATNFGVRPGHQSYHKWGPTISASASWPLAKNINWSTRFKWDSNLTYTSFEWQNDFSFQVSKYINATLHIYPRYNDSNPGAKNKNGRYFFFKESLSMGMNYNF